MAYLIKTVRVTPEEYDIITRAAEALKAPRAQLVQDGIISAGYRLGIYAGAPDAPARPRKLAAALVPAHREESCTMRFSISYSPTTYEILHRAAELAGASESRFAVGAALRHIGDLQKNPFVSTAKVPASIQPDYKKLRQIELPEQYTS